MALPTKNKLVVNKNQFIKILSPHAQEHVSAILQVSLEQQVSPFIITALGERESGWGKFLDANLCGDSGHGHGYLQIDDRSFGPWLAQHNWKEDYTNVTFGIELLKKNIAFFSGKELVEGLADGKTVSVHAHAAEVRGCIPGTYAEPRPLQGSDLIYAAIASYNTGVGNVLMSVAVGVDADLTTAGGNYAKDVIARANALLAAYNAEGGQFNNPQLIGG